jgi:hypothetical protein
MADTYDVKEIQNKYCKPKSKAPVNIGKQIGRSATNHHNKNDL